MPLRTIPEETWLQPRAFFSLSNKCPCLKAVFPPLCSRGINASAPSNIKISQEDSGPDCQRWEDRMRRP